MDGSKVISGYEVTLLQLVENGLCSWTELKSGSVNFRDVVKMLEYLQIKGVVQSWRLQRLEADKKAKSLIR